MGYTLRSRSVSVSISTEGSRVQIGALAPNFLSSPVPGSMLFQNPIISFVLDIISVLHFHHPPLGR